MSRSKKFSLNNEARTSVILLYFAFVMLGVPITIISTIRFIHTLKFAKLLRSIPHIKVSEATTADLGPAIWQGQLTGPSNRFTPTDKPSSGYSSWINHHSGKNTTSCCYKENLETLLLSDNETSLSLVLPKQNASVYDSKQGMLYFRYLLPNPALMVLYNEFHETKQIPPSQLVAANGLKSPKYLEGSFTPNAPVEVLACKKNNSLVKCPGLPFILSGQTMQGAFKAIAHESFSFLFGIYCLMTLLMILVSLSFFGVIKLDTGGG